MNPLGRLAAWWQKNRLLPSLGERGEAAAAKYLKRLGYRIVAQRSDPAG